MRPCGLEISGSGGQRIERGRKRRRRELTSSALLIVQERVGANELQVRRELVAEAGDKVSELVEEKRRERGNLPECRCGTLARESSSGS